MHREISSKSLPVGFTGLKKCAKTHKVGAIPVIFSTQMASLDHHGYLRCTIPYLLCTEVGVNFKVSNNVMLYPGYSHT